MECTCTTGEIFKFDTEDYEHIKEYTWRAQRNVVATTYKRKCIVLTRLLFPEIPSSKKILLKFPLDYRKKNIFTGNKYTLIDNCYYEVECYSSDKFKIDKEDFTLIKDFTWHVDSNGYVVTKINGGGIKLHRLLMGVIDNSEFEVDHINHDLLDNRKNNLRLADRSLNCFNRRLAAHNHSGQQGVYFNTSANKWCVQIDKNGQRYYLGTYNNLQEAIAVRKKAELFYYGEYTPNNYM